MTADDREEWAFSKPLEELPTFLSVVTLLDDARPERTIRGFVSAERKSPPKYDAARALILRALAGEISAPWATAQAAKIRNVSARECAMEVLRPATAFLTGAHKGRAMLLTGLRAELREGLYIAVSPVWLRATSPLSVLVLHLWRTPLSFTQKRQAATLLHKALATTPYYSAELDFVSIALPEKAISRRCSRLGWHDLPLLSSAEFDAFAQRLGLAWDEYKLRPPRTYKRRRPPDLFNA